MEDVAKDFYSQGYSCSESVIKSAATKGFVHEDLVKLGTAFSGGMSSGCLCGSVAGAQIVISALEGRLNNQESSAKCRALAKEFVEKFKQKNKATCCKVLSAKYKDNPVERRANCKRLVGDAAKILNEIVSKEVKV